MFVLFVLENDYYIDNNIGFIHYILQTKGINRLECYF